MLQPSYHKLRFLHFAVLRVFRVVLNGDLESEWQRRPRDGLERLPGRDEARDRIDREVGRLSGTENRVGDRVPEFGEGPGVVVGSLKVSVDV